MTEMSLLRRRMIEDMTVRNLSPATQRSYVHGVAQFGRFFGRSPDPTSSEQGRSIKDPNPAGTPTTIGWPIHTLRKTAYCAAVCSAHSSPP
jgi:integrase/recombinase XerD